MEERETIGRLAAPERAKARSGARDAENRKLRIRARIPCYLVDPASSHMLVSKIKPCMSKYKPQ